MPCSELPWVCGMSSAFDNSTSCFLADPESSLLGLVNAFAEYAHAVLLRDLPAGLPWIPTSLYVPALGSLHESKLSSRVNCRWQWECAPPANSLILSWLKLKGPLQEAGSSKTGQQWPLFLISEESPC